MVSAFPILFFQLFLDSWYPLAWVENIKKRTSWIFWYLRLMRIFISKRAVRTIIFGFQQFQYLLFSMFQYGKLFSMWFLWALILGRLIFSRKLFSLCNLVSQKIFENCISWYLYFCTNIYHNFLWAASKILLLTVLKNLNVLFRQNLNELVFGVVFQFH